MLILIDNGHGLDTPGKRSPDGKFLEATYKQNKEGLKAALKVSFALISIFSLSGILSIKEFYLETLLFQITMPGFDEEIMFRAILLGLMCSALRNTNKEYKNPAIIIN